MPKSSCCVCCRKGSSAGWWKPALIPLAARVLFATHRNLPQMVEEGKFRSDLFYRVNVMQIPVPPLRQRSEDIPGLANHFMNKYSADYRKPIEQIHASAMARLVDYDWPGNVRELENAIARAVIVAQERSILLKDLPESLQSEDDLESIEEAIGIVSSFEAQLRDYKIKLVNRARALLELPKEIKPWQPGA